jgi:hypothetical protein
VGRDGAPAVRYPSVFDQHALEGWIDYLLSLDAP